jgi:hypothetical protein
MSEWWILPCALDDLRSLHPKKAHLTSCVLSLNTHSRAYRRSCRVSYGMVVMRSLKAWHQLPSTKTIVPEHLRRRSLSPRASCVNSWYKTLMGALQH